LDARCDERGDWCLPVHGWTERSGASLERVLDSYAASTPALHLLCTDIARDGMMSGPSIELYRRLRARYHQARIQASGGVRDATDLDALRDTGVAGAIVGRALLDGAMKLAEIKA
jgi:phosphoribosylformimino-5-aminoimidazole carboxamide ribotide isomerase